MKIKDYKKLILVFNVGVKDIPMERACHMCEQVSKKVLSEFDETVKCLIFPDLESSGIEVKSINSEKIKPAELQTMIERAETYCRKMRTYMHNARHTSEF